MLIGLTGGIGAGKSTVAAGFARRGATIIDADVIAREVVEPGTPGLDAVVARFGKDVLDDEGALDRAALAEIVFSDPSARGDLEGIVHPEVGREILRRVEAAGPDAVVVVDIPLLAPSQADMYDKIVVVEAPVDLRVERLEGRGLDADGARARIRVQPTDEQRRELADFVITNSGDRTALEWEMDRVWAGLTKGS
jgi:dephospho-CoA kinase